MKIVGDPIWERFRNKTGSLVGIKTFNQSNLRVVYRIQRYFLKRSLERSKLVLTPSKQLAGLVSDWKVNSPVRVINNGIQCRELESNILKYDVVSVSRLVTWKNIDKLINACANQNLSLAICGDGPERSRLELLAVQLNCNVIFFGNLTSSEVREVINASRVYALLSDYEGLSFSLLEAMMAGKEILVSTAPGNTDVISNGVNGRVIDVEDEDGIANTLSQLVNASGNKLGVNAYDDVRANFCAEKQLDLAIETMELKE
jgi:glycosyltransferase involved in cell wall biosynthesis